VAGARATPIGRISLKKKKNEGKERYSNRGGRGKGAMKKVELTGAGEAFTKNDRRKREKGVKKKWVGA